MVRSSYASHSSPPPLTDGATRFNSTLSVPIQNPIANAQISTLHVANLRLRAVEIALGAQLKKRGKSSSAFNGRESAVRFHPFHPPLFFASNVVLSSHSIIGYPFPNDGYVSAALALGARRPIPSLDHYPRSLGVKAVLTLVLP
jgi:hypothetical protein